MNIAITGANGFIGSNLCNLLKKNHNIFAFSKHSDKINKNDIRFLECDISDLNLHIDEINNFKPDILIHCAWIGGNSYTFNDSLTQYLNIEFGIKILNIFRDSGIKKFIGLGSGAEYGPHQLMVNEESYFLPNTLYGMTKNYFKNYSSSFCKINDISHAWVLPMYTYGYNDVASRFIPSLICKCLNNSEIILNSSNSLIDYLFIDDFVEGINAIIENNLSGIYNISSGQTYHAKEIIDLISNMTNFKNKIIFDSKLDRSNYANFFCASSSKLQFESDWYPKTPIQEGIRKTLQFIKKQI